MADRGRDIGPDEERLNYTPAQADQLSEDADPLAISSPVTSSGLSLGIRSRNRQQIIQEPVDTTPDAVGAVYDRVFAPQRQRNAAFAGSFVREEARLQTFSDWKFQHVVAKEDLARNGFIYTGTGDKVRCVFCNGILRQWEAGDVVEEEHRRNYPACPFLGSEDVGNVPLEQTVNGHGGERNAVSDARPFLQAGREPLPDPGFDISPAEEGYAVQPMDDTVAGKANFPGHRSSQACASAPRNPEMATEAARLATFKTWPVQLKQRPRDLAQAGLYYIGDGDRVRCFHCHGLLYGWEPVDDPFQEHARWFPDCEYIRLVKGERFVSDVQNGRVTDESVMQTPSVLAVLYEGHSVDTVQRALFVMRQKHGADVLVTAWDLLTTVLELENTSEDQPSTNSRALPDGNPADSTAKDHSEHDEIEKLQQENETLRDKQLCKICMDKDVEVIFYPCKHFVCCTSCGASLSHCPICRVTIDSVDRVFMA